MREIEIKARVADKPRLLGILNRQNVTLSSPITQRDRVWIIEGAKPGSGSPALRIRTETKNGTTKQLFTLKKSLTNQMDSIEHETEIQDDEELAHIIRHLEFIPYSDLTKIRQKAMLGEIEICVDSVDGLGDFIEIERLTDEDVDYDSVADELWGVLEKFGVTRGDYVTDGYDVLQRRSQGLGV